MANNTEIVGKILASSILLNEERQLLRVRDTSAPVAHQKPQPPNVPVALANDSKAVAAVLLTLLDERIQAAEADGADRSNPFQTPAEAQDDGRSMPAHVGARYAETLSMPNADAVAANPIVQTGQVFVPAAQVGGAPDLQSFIQRLAAAAAQRSTSAGLAPGFASGLYSRLGSSAGPLLVAGAAVALFVWLGIIVAGFLFA